MIPLHQTFRRYTAHALARATLAAVGLVMQLAPGVAVGQAGSRTERDRPESACRRSPSGTTRLRDVAGHDASPCAGDIVFTLRNRTFLIPDRVVDGLKIQPTVGIRWSPNDALTLSLDNQTVDNSGPGRQGRYRAMRTVGAGGGSGNFLQETAASVDARLWRNAPRTLQVWIQGSLSKGVRSYHATDSVTGEVSTGNRRELVPSGALLIDAQFSRGRLSMGPAVVGFPTHNALYLRVLPGDTALRFGTTTGARFEGSYRAAPALSVWSTGFLPTSGNNTISRATGRPERAPVWDAGLALHINPALDLEFFASNALGNTGALAFVADREYKAVGTGVIFRPFSHGERPSDAARNRGETPPEFPAPLSLTAVVASATRGATASMSFGGQGLLAAVDLSPVEALHLGAYLDNTPGIVDEGELGARLAVRLLHDPGGLSLGATVTGARTNNVLVNLLSNRPDEFVRRGMRKSGFSFGDESAEEAKLYVVTGSVSAQREFGGVAMLWVAPTIAVVQRRGVQIAGISSGVTGRLTPAFSVVAEAGADLSSHGNTLTREGRVHRIPWAVALVRHFSLGAARTPLLARVFVSNRVGESPFHSLRVRRNGSTTMGVGVSVPLWETR